VTVAARATLEAARALTVALGADASSLPSSLGTHDRVWTYGSGAADAGVIVLRHLDFDTELFGRPVARLVATGASERAHELLLAAAIGDLRARRYAHAVVTLAADDLPQLWALTAAGFRVTDLGVIFSRRLESHARSSGRGGSAKDDSIRVRASADEDLPALADLAARIFTRSRFFVDPFYGRDATEELHRRWITNLHHGLADIVLVALAPASTPIGFVTCRVQAGRGDIALVGVDPAHRGKGVARTLLDEALQWFAEHGAREVRVKTQATNYPAATLYERAGFCLVHADVTATRSSFD
jgi:ribosomal protein S18 acetylase RimI-like enzyme